MPNEEIIALIAVLMLTFGVIVVTLASVTIVNMIRRIEKLLTLMDDSGAPPSTTVEKPRLFRRTPEPEPGGTKVYPREAWDEGLERTDV